MRRPDHLDLAKASHAPTPSITSPRSFHLDLPSPRVGEVPPALSPLDAFAQQSRMLAKRFEESQLQGRRLSRLDHTEVATQLGKKTPYFRSSAFDEIDAAEHLPEDHLNADLPLLPRTGSSTPRQLDSAPHEVAKPSLPAYDNRPVSHYPQFGHGSTTPHDMQDGYGHGHNQRTEPRPKEYFDFPVRRAESPEPIDVTSDARGKPNASPRVPSLTGSADSAPSTQRTNTDDSLLTDNALAPPRSAVRFPRSQRSNVSIRSVMDSADDEYGQRTAYIQELAPPRKFSGASAISGRRSPLAHINPTHSPRSPSNMSDRSADSDYRRPSFNFSRPRSGGSAKQWSEGRPSLSSRPSDSNISFEFPQRKLSMDMARSPLRQESGSTTHSRADSRQHTMSPADEVPTPLLESAAPSYIYSKFSLPRGRGLDRNSGALQSPWAHEVLNRDDMTPARPTQVVDSPRSAVDDRGRPLHLVLDMNKSRSRSVDAQQPAQRAINYHKAHPSSPSVTSASTDRTIRAHAQNSASEEIAHMTPEQHLEEGISNHTSGSLSKSTYHLRLAARGGLPTAMLLYALACRHGWGMRANQQEGIIWLKRAVDSASLDLISNDKAITKSTAISSTVSTTLKRDANFALAVYELGISYMNGWGIPKDKSLALRCFEIAGNWGDCDALAEAGFCYTQGVGCKKDLKKAASYYRKAADGGMSMAGNSW